MFYYNELYYNKNTNTVVITTNGGKIIKTAKIFKDFTKSEYEICEFLMKNRGQVFSRDQLYEKVYGYDGNSDSSTISEHVKNIRSKLKEYNKEPIETVWGIGYKWIKEWEL